VTNTVKLIQNKTKKNKTKSHSLLATQPIVANDRTENKHPPFVTKLPQTASVLVAVGEEKLLPNKFH